MTSVPAVWAAADVRASAHLQASGTQVTANAHVEPHHNVPRVIGMRALAASHSLDEGSGLAREAAAASVVTADTSVAEYDISATAKSGRQARQSGTLAS
jgi:hypothetical protein